MKAIPLFDADDSTVVTNSNMDLGFYSPILHDFAGKGEYNVLRGVSKK